MTIENKSYTHETISKYTCLAYSDKYYHKYLIAGSGKKTNLRRGGTTVSGKKPGTTGIQDGNR
jgi:hypothetical protein